MNLGLMGKALILAGIVFIVFGAIFVIFGRVPFLGKLPGDIVVHKKNFTVYFPVATSILISVVLTAILIIINLIRK